MSKIRESNEVMAMAANSYQPVNAQQVLTKTYRPQGDAQIPTSVPNLVSGVNPAQSSGSQQTAPATKPTSSPASNGQNGGN
jgi:hypothetical protein